MATVFTRGYDLNIFECAVSGQKKSKFCSDRICSDPSHSFHSLALRAESWPYN